MTYKKILREYFYFDRQRRRGIIALICISVLMVSLPYIAFSLRHKETISQAKLDSLKIILNASQQETAEMEMKDATPGELFYFDPNKASRSELLQLGIKENVVDRLINYRSKGGVFRTADDLMKTYGFTEKDMERLRDFIVFENEKTETHEIKKEYIAKENTSFDPNLLTQQQWLDLHIAPYAAERIINYRSKGGVFRKPDDILKIYGFPQQDYERLKDRMVFNNAPQYETKADSIIPHYVPKEIVRHNTEINSATAQQFMELGFSGDDADHIVRYRKGLGGFYAAEQMLYIEGIDQQMVRDATAYLQVDKGQIKKLNINTAAYDDLEKHIYISAALAQAIIDYRTTYGNFIVLTEMKKVKGMSSGLYDKLIPYFTL